MTPDDAFHSMLDSRFVAVTSPPFLVDEALYPDERLYIAGAVEKRRAEFGTVRVCARRALAKIGIEAFSLVPRSDRSPHWKAGVIGSMSHTDDLCAAVVTCAPEILALGIDVEQDTPLDSGLQEIFCTSHELGWIRSHVPALQGALGKLFFSAKESFYKCQYSLTATSLDLKGIELRFDMSKKTFYPTRLEESIEVSGNLMTVSGRFCFLSGLVLTSAVLES